MPGDDEYDFLFKGMCTRLHPHPPSSCVLCACSLRLYLLSHSAHTRTRLRESHQCVCFWVTWGRVAWGTYSDIDASTRNLREHPFSPRPARYIHDASVCGCAVWERKRTSERGRVRENLARRWGVMNKWTLGIVRMYALFLDKIPTHMHYLVVRH